jgi:lipopolysaccharide/colanic/teichoic acid biosynthesis glycosyltransferase
MNHRYYPENTDVEIIGLSIDDIYQKNKINHPRSRFVKRILDVFLASLMLIFIAPWLFLIVSIIIVFESKGSPFFVQKRTGRDRKTFLCIKFRTMTINKEADRLQVQKDDKRITRVGKYLRELHIDELPQVINVLAGQMSIVGPRPHMLRHNVEYSWLSENYHLRHQAKPGLTGLAQVRGYHGMINNREDYVNRLSSDIEYINNWSIYTDVEIFFRTTFQIIFRKD